MNIGVGGSRLVAMLSIIATPPSVRLQRQVTLPKYCPFWVPPEQNAHVSNRRTTAETPRCCMAASDACGASRIRETFVDSSTENPTVVPREDLGTS